MIDRATILANAAKRDDRPIVLSDSESEEDQKGVDELHQFKGVGGKKLEALREMIRLAESFIQSDAFKNLQKDQVTITGKWTPETILATSEEAHTINSLSDLQLLRGSLNEFEVSLLSGPSYSMENLFNTALSHIVENKETSGPSLERCLAWMGRAAQTSIQNIVPHGEIYPSSERYVIDHLTQPLLPKLEKKEDREKTALHQLGHTLSLLSCLDLRLQSTSDLSILLFAITRLSIDRLIDASIHSKAINLMNCILNVPEKNQREIVLEFCKIFPGISDDYTTMLRCMELFRLCESAPSACLPLLCALLIHKTERAECEPDQPNRMTDRGFISTYLKVLVDVLPATFDECAKDRNTELSIVMMIDMALSRHVLEKGSRKDIERVLHALNHRKRDLIKANRPDEALIEIPLRFCIDRIDLTMKDMVKTKEEP